MAIAISGFMSELLYYRYPYYIIYEKYLINANHTIPEHSGILP